MPFYQKQNRLARLPYLLTFGLLGLLVAITWNLSVPHKQSTTEDRLLEPATITYHESLAADENIPDISFADFIARLQSSHTETRNEVSADINSSEDDVSLRAQTMAIEEAEREQQKAEYQHLLAYFNQANSEEKIQLLQKLRQLALNIGITEELLVLLQLTTYDPDSNIENTARNILNDLNNFMKGRVSPEQQLVTQLEKIDNVSRRHDDTSTHDNHSSLDTHQQRNKVLEELKAIALSSENSDTKDYALNNLMQFDQGSALEVIQHQLLNSTDNDDRFKAIEHLRSSIGKFDSDTIRQALQNASYDYDTTIANYAQVSLDMLDEFLQPQETKDQLYEITNENSDARHPVTQ